jgi:hypothetical protein
MNLLPNNKRLPNPTGEALFSLFEPHEVIKKGLVTFCAKRALTWQDCEDQVMLFEYFDSKLRRLNSNELEDFIGQLYEAGINIRRQDDGFDESTLRRVFSVLG